MGGSLKNLSEIMAQRCVGIHGVINKNNKQCHHKAADRGNNRQDQSKLGLLGKGFSLSGKHGACDTDQAEKQAGRQTPDAEHGKQSLASPKPPRRTDQKARKEPVGRIWGSIPLLVLWFSSIRNLPRLHIIGSKKHF